MNARLFFAILLTAAMLTMVAACAEYDVREGSFAPVRVRDENLPGTQIRWNNVSLLDASIKNKIFVEGTNSRRTPTGTLEVWAIFRNRTDYPQQIECRASFYDSSYAPVEGPTGWQRLFLSPNAAANYRNVFSTQIEIGYYNIEVREGR